MTIVTVVVNQQIIGPRRQISTEWPIRCSPCRITGRATGCVSAPSCENQQRYSGATTVCLFAC